uniref:translation initiation factor 2 n=1 Tax=Glaucosphaera vacuolata TaxID=38265 RepID=UPI001FCCE1BC|nr:translation initiation factor 2 [Glaucosphaera vacuolata]UNJ18708.1 translation initiation factor 2 [Glaucosphaera vacuolata]
MIELKNPLLIRHLDEPRKPLIIQSSSSESSTATNLVSSNTLSVNNNSAEDKADNKLKNRKKKRILDKFHNSAEEEISNKKNYLKEKQQSIKLSKTPDLIDNIDTSIENIACEEIIIYPPINLQEFATLLRIRETEIIKFLFLKGIVSTINQIMDISTIQLIAEYFNKKILIQNNAKDISTDIVKKVTSTHLHKKPPVVTILGHIDHGKTTLLDAIVKTNIVSTESGGITQVIGTYKIAYNYKGVAETIVFIDTPGHEAFINMRSKGIKVTDIAILVVSAVEGVKPQTIEVIKDIQKFNIPTIVAITKIDKDIANITKVKEELASYGLIDESLGGNTPIIPVSALTRQNLDQLMEMILLIAEVENLQANLNQNAEGTILESYLDKSKGPVAKLLIQNGVLKVGDIIVSRTVFAKVRAILDTHSKKITSAYPSDPVEIWGFEELPMTGDTFNVYSSEKEARTFIKTHKEKNFRQNIQQTVSKLNVFYNNSVYNPSVSKKLNLIIKADVQGSIEAILNSLQQIPQKKVSIHILSSMPGEINISDVNLAKLNNAILINFNTSFAFGIKPLIKKESLNVKTYKVIYDLIIDIEKQMKSLLDPVYESKEIGEATVKTSFPISRGFVAGCLVTKGKLLKGCEIEVIRNQENIYKGSLDSLKRIKENVDEIIAGNECGILSSNFHNWLPNDIIKAYQLIEKEPSLSE